MEQKDGDCADGRGSEERSTTLRNVSHFRFYSRVFLPFLHRRGSRSRCPVESVVCMHHVQKKEMKTNA